MKDLADSFSVINEARSKYCPDMAAIDCEKYCDMLSGGFFDMRGAN